MVRSSRSAFSNKGMVLMFLSMGVLTLLLATYFIVNSAKGLNSTVGAQRKATVIGVLKADPTYKYDCNLITKAEYVLIDDAGFCVPVIANKSLADKYNNKNVEISGDLKDDKYYVVGFKTVNNGMTPKPIKSPSAERYKRGVVPLPTNIDY